MRRWSWRAPAPRWAELARAAAAFAGQLLWLVMGFVAQQGALAKQAYRCRGRTFTGAFDDCFNDYIPVLEVVLPYLAWLALFVVVPVTLTFFAPPAHERYFKWPLVPDDGAASIWPLMPALAALGIAWAGWRLLSYPLAGEFFAFHLYRATVAFWFAGAIAIGLRDRGVRP